MSYRFLDMVVNFRTVEHTDRHYYKNTCIKTDSQIDETKIINIGHQIHEHKTCVYLKLNSRAYAALPDLGELLAPESGHWAARGSPALAACDWHLGWHD